MIKFAFIYKKLPNWKPLFQLAYSNWELPLYTQNSINTHLKWKRHNKILIEFIEYFRSYQSFGLVRERILEYDRHLDWDSRGREVSVTSSEGLSDDYGEEEKTFKETFRSKKTFIKSTPAQQTFLKSRTSQIKGDSSPPSSDEHDWVRRIKLKSTFLSNTL